MIITHEADNDRVKLCVSKDGILKHLIHTLFIIESLFLLFPVWPGSPVWHIITVEQYWVFVDVAGYIFLLFAIILIAIIRKVDKWSLYLLIALEFVFLMSLIVTGGKSGLLGLWGIPISYIVLFDLLRRYAFQRKLLIFFTYILLLWCILPIVYFPFASTEQKILFFSSVDGSLATFSGFALHRNLYGMVLGMAFILLLKQKNIFNYSVKFLLFVFLGIGMFLSASRSALVSVVLVLFYDYFFYNKRIFLRRVHIMLFSVIILFTAYSLYNEYSLRKGVNNDSRIELYEGFASSIKKYPVWGYGEPVKYYSTRYPEGSSAHNFIIQLWADYGGIVLLVYLSFLAYVFLKYHHNARLFLLYSMIWGLFQPYFGFGVPTAQICIPLMIGYFLDNNENKPAIK